MATAEKAEELPKLPSEIIRDILAFLPVKSSDVFYQRRRVLISDMWELFSINLNEFLNGINLDDRAVKQLGSSTHVLEFRGLVMDSDGLLFSTQFSLFNPAINQNKSLPIPPTYDIFSEEVCGFGFDLSSLDYKAVHGSFFRDELKFSVYSLKTGSGWRLIQTGHPYRGPATPAMKGRLLNGGVHWLVCKPHDRSSMVMVSLVCFVLADENVSEIPLPPSFADEEEGYLNVFDECLCVGKQYAQEFWVMKEYGMAKSWTKISISIPVSEGLHSGFVKKNHHLFLQDNLMFQRLVLYNLDKKRNRNLSIRGIHELCSAVVYLESLVSPNNCSTATADGDGIGASLHPEELV